MLDSLLPDRQEDEEQDTRTSKDRPANQALKDNLMLQLAQVGILNSELPVKDHKTRQQPEQALAFRPDRSRVIEPLPRQRLSASEQEEEEATTSQARQDQADPHPPHGPGGKGLPAGVCADVRREGAQEGAHEPGDGEDDSQGGGDAEGLESAVGDAQADEVAVRAVAEELVDVVGDGLEVDGVRGGLQAEDGLLAHRGRDVELLFGSGEEEGLDDDVEFRAEAGGGVHQGGVAGGRRLGGLGSAAHHGLDAGANGRSAFISGAYGAGGNQLGNSAQGLLSCGVRVSLRFNKKKWKENWLTGLSIVREFRDTDG